MSKIPGFRSGKTWKKIVAVFGYLVIISLIYGAITGKNNSEPTTTTTTPPKQDTSAPASTTPSVPAKPQDPKQSISNTIVATINSKVEGKPQLENSEINEILADGKPSGKYTLGIHLLATEGWDVKGSMEATLSTLKDASKKIFADQKNISDIAYYVDTDLKDQYGKVTKGLWFRVVLKGEDGYKIQYDNLTTAEFGKFLEIQAGTIEARNAFEQVVNQ